MNSPWNKPLQLFLVIVVSLNLIPNLSLVPVWIAAATAILLIWKLLHLLRGVALPKPIYLLGLGFVMTVMIVFNRKALFGQDAGTDLLVLFASFKLLETRRYRDVMINVMLCFFLLMIHLLNSQSLFTSAYFVVDLLLITQVLLQLHPGNTSLVSVKAVLRLMFMTIPLWVALFIFFPRFTVGFVQQAPKASTTGLSDEMDPGDISEVARSNETAFRARFSGTPLKPNDLYWRGMILGKTTGLRWTKISNDLPDDEFLRDQPDSSGGTIPYEVFLEPLFKKWVFKLEYPGFRERKRLGLNSIVRTPGLIYEFQQDIVSRVVYMGERHANAPLQELSDEERELFLQLPKFVEPEVLALANQLKVAGNPLQSMQNLLGWYHNQGFRYMLDPGVVPGRSIKGFLFQGKRGFCEHYAAASGVILRAMGIPTRVVLGFQGGERNSLGDYWIIKKANAHSWNEAWVPTDPKKSADVGRWVRFDAVRVVAPVRLAMGADYFQLTPVQQVEADSNAVSFQIDSSLASHLQTKARLAWDALEMQWGSFLLSYDFEFQQAWLKKLGLKDTSRITFFSVLLISMTLFIAGIAWWLQRKSRVKDPVLLLWKKFQRKMEKKGFIRKTSEGPRDYLNRVIEGHAQSDVVGRIGELYLELRYQEQSSAHSQKFVELRNRVRNLK